MEAFHCIYARRRLVGFFVLLLLISVLRRPDVLLAANFWAEDGTFWYAQLYNDGLVSLLHPQNGYFQMVSRLTMLVASFWGIAYVPAVANLISLCIRVLPVLFLFSSRVSFIKQRNKILLTIYYLLMPNLDEVYGNITNIHWFLALYLLLVLMAEPADTLKWKIHDFALLLISGLSGPFIGCLFPCLLLKKAAQYKKEGKFSVEAFDVVFVCLLGIQGASVLMTATGTRSTAPLGASLAQLAKLVDAKILLGTFFTNKFTYDMVNLHEHRALLAFFAFFVLLVGCFFKGSWRFKAGTVFPVCMLSAALAKPMISWTEPQWEVLLLPYAGERYFVVTNILIFCFILYLLDILFEYGNRRLFKGGYVILVLCMVVMALHAFRIQPLPNQNYREEIQQIYYPAKSGDIVKIPINPAGWEVILKKK